MLAPAPVPQARTDWVAKFEKPATDPSALILPLSAPRTAPANPFDAAKKCVAARDAPMHARRDAHAAVCCRAAEARKGKGKGAAEDGGCADAGAACAVPSPAVSALLTPSTTALSPYLKFGCVSSRLFASRVRAVYASAASHSAPPVSLLGQLLWRDFYYAVALGTPRFDAMAGNPICRQVPWGADAALLAAWEHGRTGFPWIDAAMVQLRTQGWLHHLARHSVACFLTRGDLWQSWEAGAAVFDRLLLDADWALNNGNWMWLSASAFFHQFFRVYSPVAFPKKYDPKGAYVRHFLPALRAMPDKYIYEPWKAPLDVQKAAGCIIGTHYPAPVVDHETASKANIARMSAAYAAHRAANGEEEEQGGAPAAKKAKRAK
jgi:cryptochrome